MEIITAKDMSKLYPNGQGIHTASFSIKKGEFVGVLGPSGAGKSTLMRLLCGAIYPTQGSLKILGKDMMHLNRKQLYSLRNKITTVYQNFNVIPSLDVARNVWMGRASLMSHFSILRGMLKLTYAEETEITKVLNALGIKDKLYERCQELSGGQQQRVAVARAIYSGADLVLADEPVASVDPATSEVILNMFQVLNNEGKTIVLSLHQIQSALKYCSRILAFDRGILLFDGRPHDFSKSDVCHRLMGSNPNMEARAI